jgi:hypothetical protein
MCDYAKGYLAGLIAAYEGDSRDTEEKYRAVPVDGSPDLVEVWTISEIGCHHRTQFIPDSDAVDVLYDAVSGWAVGYQHPAGITITRDEAIKSEIPIVKKPE